MDVEVRGERFRAAGFAGGGRATAEACGLIQTLEKTRKQVCPWGLRKESSSDNTMFSAQETPDPQSCPMATVGALHVCKLVRVAVGHCPGARPRGTAEDKMNQTLPSWGLPSRPETGK